MTQKTWHHNDTENVVS